MTHRRVAEDAEGRKAWIGPDWPLCRSTLPSTLRPLRLCGENLLLTDTLNPPPTFAPAASALGIEFEPGDVEKLGRYLALLLETNKQFNLTAIKEPDEAWSRHILDSLTLIALLAELAKQAKVIDVGSGGGLPGIPL